MKRLHSIALAFLVAASVSHAQTAPSPKAPQTKAKPVKGIVGADSAQPYLITYVKRSDGSVDISAVKPQTKQEVNKASNTDRVSLGALEEEMLNSFASSCGGPKYIKTVHAAPQGLQFGGKCKNVNDFMPAGGIIPKGKSAASEEFVRYNGSLYLVTHKKEEGNKVINIRAVPPEETRQAQRVRGVFENTGEFSLFKHAVGTCRSANVVSASSSYGSETVACDDGMISVQSPSQGQVSLN